MEQKGQINTSHVKRMTRQYVLRLVAVCSALSVLIGLSLPLLANATTSISQSYTADEKLSLGAIVSLKDSSSDQIVAAQSSNVDGLLGVVIDAGNSLLSFSSDQGNQVQIATSGTLQLLVSDINGNVLRGDHITASPISGVGMKATGNVRIVGIAQSDLKGSKQSYTDKAGHKQSVILGEIPALINISYYFKEPEKTLVPAALQEIVNSLAGKSVSTLPIIISSAIFIVTVIVVVSIVYSMIRSSIISVGRNPMSQSAIWRDLIQLSALVLAILTVGMIAIYLVLTRM